MKLRHWNFLALCFWLFSSLGFAFVAYARFGQDFRGYYAAAFALRLGGNPYDYRLVADLLRQFTGFMGNNPFYYPPWLAWMVFPLTFLPFQDARAVWMTLNWALWTACLAQMAHLFPWPLPGWRRYLFFWGLTFSFAWITWRYEQAAILVLFALLQALQQAQRKQAPQMAFWLLMALLKPNIALLPVLSLMLWFSLRQGRQLVLWLGAFTGAALLLFGWFTPQPWQPFVQPGFGSGLRQALDGPGQVVAARINTTLFDWLTVLFHVPSFLAALTHILAAAAALLAWVCQARFWKSPLQALNLGILLSFLVTPYALQYDYPLLVLPFWTALAALPRRNFGALGLMFFVFSVSLWQQNIAWGYWMALGTALLAALAGVMESRRAAQTA